MVYSYYQNIKKNRDEITCVGKILKITTIKDANESVLKLMIN